MGAQPATMRGTLPWRQGVATSLLLLFLGIEVLGILDLPRQPYSGLLLRHDVEVMRVDPGSPADRAGFQPGDLIRASSPEGRPTHPGDRLAFDVRRGEENLTLSLTLASRPSHDVAREISLGLVGVIFLLVAYIVILRRGDSTALVFALLSLELGALFMNRPQWLHSRWPLFDKGLSDALILLLPALFLHFFLVFPEPHPWVARRPALLRWLYVPSVGAVIISIPLSMQLLSSNDLPGPGARAFEKATVVYFMGALVAAVFLFLRSYARTRQPRMRRRLKGVVIGTLLGVIPLGLVTTAIQLFPRFEVPGYRFAPIALVLIPLSFGHAIIRYGLMDVEVVVKRGAVYAIVSAALAGVYLAVVNGLGRAVEENAPGDARTVLTFVSILLMAALFSPLRVVAQRWVDRTFYRERYNYRETLRELSGALAREIDQERILDRLAACLDATLHPTHLALFLRERTGGSLALVRTSGTVDERVRKGLDAEGELPRWLARRVEPLSLERFGEDGLGDSVTLSERRFVARLDAAVLVPFISEGELLGLLALGAKRSQERMSGDDLELLGTLSNQAATALQNARLHEEDLARQRVEQELSLARKVQQTLLPPSRPAIAGVEFLGLSRPSTEIGGDLYDYVELAPDRLALVVGDAVGHGIPAALLVASLQATVRGEAASGRPPREVVTLANRHLCQRTDESRFASLFYGELDLATGRLRYVNAGHLPPLVANPAEDIVMLETGGLLLGIEPAAAYAEGAALLSPGSLLVLYTDGIVEEEGFRLEPFGLERLLEIVRGGAELPLQNLGERIFAELERHAGGHTADDATVVLVRFAGIQAAGGGAAAEEGKPPEERAAARE